MTTKNSEPVLRRLRLLGVEVIGSSIFLLALVIYIWGSNSGSSWQAVFLWMAIISVVVAIAGVQILQDIKHLSPSAK